MRLDRLPICDPDTGDHLVVVETPRGSRNKYDFDPRLHAMRLAAVLPDPKGRNAAKPTDFLRKRARSILSGAETIAADGRAGCFQ